MLTRTLASFVVDTRFSDIPAQVVQRAKRHVLDTIGVMLAGSRQKVGHLVERYVAHQAATPKARVMGTDLRTAPALAALANGTMAHALDFDDDSDTVYSHPSATLLPAIWAAGGEAASGRRLLTAFILGHEVSARAAKIPGLMPGHYKHGWHPTATLGIIGATAAAAKIRQLDRDRLRWALGIACSEAGGLRANFGTMTKPLHAGSTASKAVTAVLLAEAGLTANPDVLESPAGFVDVFGGNLDQDLTSVTTSLGSQWDLVSPGVNIKQYPCCYYTHTAIDLLCDMMQQHRVGFDQIRRIRCTISPLAQQVLSPYPPNNASEAKFYLPYCLAVAARYGRPAPTHFDDPCFQNSDIRQMMAQIDVAPEPAFGKDRFGFTTRIELTANDQTTRSDTRQRPNGSGSRPLSWDDLCLKFRSCVSGILDRKETAAVEAAIRNMPQLASFETVLHQICRSSEDTEPAGNGSGNPV